MRNKIRPPGGVYGFTHIAEVLEDTLASRVLVN